MKFHQPSESTIQRFEEIVGTGQVITEDELLENYSHDETEDLRFLPAIVIKPTSAQEISEIFGGKSGGTR